MNRWSPSLNNLLWKYSRLGLGNTISPASCWSNGVTRSLAALHWLFQTILVWGWWVLVTSVLGVVASPGLDKPDWLGSSQMLEEILGTKGTTKHCLQGLLEHDCPHPNLFWAPSHGEGRRSWKEKPHFQQNLNLPPVFQRVTRCTFCNCTHSLKGSINTTCHGCLHKETMGCCSPGRVWKGQPSRGKKILCRCDITSYIISWPNLRSWISSNQN